MATVVIDLYDSGISISDGKQILVNSETCALIEPDNSIVVGEPAKQYAHLRPREISTQFWGQLSSSSNTKYTVSNAELAFEHLQFAWKHAAIQKCEVILTTPNTLNKQDLGLLLGICEKLSIPAQGMVSNVILALPGPVANSKTVYLDVMQQQTAITEISQSKTGISLPQPSRILGYGKQSLINNLAKSVAKIFIAETRFDPMYRAKDEQQFFDKLPVWLAGLETSNSVDCKLTSDNNHYRIQLDRKHLFNTNQHVYKEITACLNALFSDQDIVTIICSPSCAQVYRLLNFLKGLPACAVLPLKPTSMAKQALLYQQQIQAKDQHVHYCTSLTWHQDVKPLNLKFNKGTLAKLNNVPTHVLINNQAFPLTHDVFINLNNNGNDLVINSTCKETALCKISIKDLLVKIKRLKNHTIKLNNEILNTPCSVQVGDHLTIAGHKNDVHFIKVAHDETQIG